MSALPPALAWDLDGTLIDSAPDICRALNSILVENGHHPLAEEQVRPMIGDGVAKLVERGFAAAGRALDDRELQRMVATFMVHYATNPAGRTRLYPGAVDAIAGLAAAGVRQAICTNKPEGISKAVLRDLGVEHYFDAIVGGDTTAARKPDPEPLRVCLARMGAKPDMAIMIGDSAVDVATARALDMPVGLVTFGYARSEVSGIGADFLIDDLATVPELVSRRFAAQQSVSC